MVAGDVDTAEALERVRRISRRFRRDRSRRRSSPTAEPTSEKRLMLEDRVELPRLYLAWHSPAMFADGDAGDGSAVGPDSPTARSRGCTALVYERRIASEVMAFQNSRELGGFWQIVATAAPGHTLEELDAGD